MMQRGRVQRDTSLGDGVVAVEGKQYAFPLERVWQTEQPPRAGMLVDVSFNAAGVPERIVAVPDAQLAREQAEQALAGVRQGGGALAKAVRSRFSIPVLAAELLLLVSFFVLPCVSIPAFGRSYSAWDVLGMDARTTLVDDRGALSLLAIVCLFAPFAVPFVKTAWTRFLYLAPLLFSLFALVSLYLEVQNAGRAAQREISGALGPMGGQMASDTGGQLSGLLHVNVGVFAVFACALYLALLARKA